MDSKVIIIFEMCPCDGKIAKFSLFTKLVFREVWGYQKFVLSRRITKEVDLEYCSCGNQRNQLALVTI